MPSSATIKFLRNHSLDYTAYYSVYETTSRDGAGMSLATAWVPLWPNPNEKIGFGLGIHGNGIFGGSGNQRELRYAGFGQGYFGLGHMGIFEKEISAIVSGLANGLHVLVVKLQDIAGNIGSGIHDNLAIWLCDVPDTPTQLTLDAVSGHSATISWTA